MSAADDRQAERQAATAQGDLFDATPARRPAGAVERAVARSVAAATVDADRGDSSDRWLTVADEGLAALAVACGRAVDLAGHRSDPYGVAAAAQRLQEALTRLRLDPSARGGEPVDGSTPLQAFLAGLAEPS